MQGQARHAQFGAFKKLSNAGGFGLIRQADLRTRAMLDTDGTQEAAANVPWTLDFFSEGTTAALGGNGTLALRTKEPNIRADTPLGNEYLFCARAVSVEVESQLIGLTEVEVMEVLRVLGQAVLQIKSGSDIIYERRIGYLLTGDAGIHGYQGTLAGGAANGVRGPVVPMKEGDDFDDPFVIFPGASVSATIHGQGAWVTADDIFATLTLHGWAGLRGAVKAGSGILSLQDWIANPAIAHR